MQDCFRERYRQLGDRIKYYRMLCGLTQEQLAEKIGRSWSFISQVESSNCTVPKGVSLETLFLLSDAMKIPVSCFFEEESYQLPGIVEERLSLDETSEHKENGNENTTP